MAKKEQIVRIGANVTWKVLRDKATGMLVGICDPLKLTVQADTTSELLSVIGETIDLLFTDLLEDGELEQFLKAKGWKLVGEPPPAKHAGHMKFDLPSDVRFANAH